MARGKKTTEEKKQVGEIPFGQVTWVLNNLSKSELEQYDENPPEASEIFSFLQRMVETGWKVSQKWDYDSKCVQVTFIQNRLEYPNSGFAFSARSDDWTDALGLCWYKFTIIANGVLADFGVDRASVRG